jgi:CBS domain-containing protein/ribosome-associated translation inhibitor RaiA
MILRKTFTELAETEIINISQTPRSVFNPDDPASKILAYFKDTSHYEAVANDGDNTGLITVRDFLGVEHPERTNIKSLWHQIGIMDVHYTVLQAVEILIDNNVRALPLVENGEITGIISQTDLVKELTNVNELGQIKAKDLMRTPVITVDSKIGNDRARSLMLDKKISNIPVTSEDKLKGMVTAEILVNTFIVPASRMTTGNLSGQMVPKFSGQVSGVMDTQPHKLGVEANAQEVAKEMTRMSKSACIIVDEQDRVQGIITPRELLKPIYDLRGEVELPIYIVGLTADEGWFDATVAENKIRRVVQRAQSMRPDIQEVRIQIEKQRTGGNRTRYEVRSHIYTKYGGETIFDKQEGWDLMAVIDNLTDSLNQLLRSEKVEQLKKPRHGRQKKQDLIEGL